MAWRDWGSTPITSTGGYSGSTGHSGLLSNPSTSDILAEINSTQFSAVKSGGLYLVTWLVGASTLAIWQLEHALSTGLGSTAIRDVTYLHTPAGQTGQYQLTYKLETNDLLRCRLQGSITGTASGKISAEPIT